MNATPGATGPADEPGPGDGQAADPDDDDLLAELRSLSGRTDPPPPDLSSLSRSLLAWHDPEAQLAALVADSLELAGTVRGDTDVVLHFRAGAAGVDATGSDGTGSDGTGSGVAIVVQISPAGDGLHRLVGQIEPAGAGRLQLCRPSGESDVDVDGLGRFVADRLQPGPMSLRWSASGSGAVVVATAWHRL